jgi:glycyl-tRNA synthetase alpha subunit
MNYAGIGSRTITADEIVKIEKVASFLNEKDAILYSGNADGADITFQKYAKSFVAYLPWSKFNYNSFDVSTNLNCLKVYDSQTKDAFDSIDLFHPNPKALSPAARKLMARNYYQINGRDEISLEEKVALEKEYLDEDLYDIFELKSNPSFPSGEES